MHIAGHPELVQTVGFNETSVTILRLIALRIIVVVHQNYSNQLAFTTENTIVCSNIYYIQIKQVV